MEVLPFVKNSMTLLFANPLTFDPPTTFNFSPSFRYLCTFSMRTEILDLKDYQYNSTFATYYEAFCRITFNAISFDLPLS